MPTRYASAASSNPAQSSNPYLERLGGDWSATAMRARDDGDFANQANRAFADQVQAGRTAGSEFQRQTGLGAGSAGGASQSSVLELMGSLQGQRAREEMFTSEQRRLDELSQADMNRLLAATTAGASEFGTQTRHASDLAQRRREASQQASIARRQIGEQARQFNQGLGLSRDQLGEQARQFDRGLSQREQEFARQLGLTENQFLESIRQFDQGLGLNRDQFAFQEDQYRDQMRIAEELLEEIRNQMAGGGGGGAGSPSPSLSPAGSSPSPSAPTSSPSPPRVDPSSVWGTVGGSLGTPYGGTRPLPW